MALREAIRLAKEILEVEDDPKGRIKELLNVLEQGNEPNVPTIYFCNECDRDGVVCQFETTGPKPGCCPSSDCPLNADEPLCTKGDSACCDWVKIQR